MSEYNSSPSIEAVVTQISHMAKDMDRMASNVAEMSKNMNRLIVAEERISGVLAGIDRVNKRLDDGQAQMNMMAAQINSLKIEAANSTRTAGVVDKVLFTIAGGAVVAALKATGVL